MDVNALCDRVRETAYAIHVFLGPGHLERVYENALAHRLRKCGVVVEQQHPFAVYDEAGTNIGNYVADLFVSQKLVVEVKAARKLSAEHVAQIIGYVKASRLEVGMLVNFGGPIFEAKRYLAHSPIRL